MSKTNDMFERKIKNFSTNDIQKAISSALLDLTGEEYDVSINSINFNTDAASVSMDKTDLEVTVLKNNEWI